MRRRFSGIEFWDGTVFGVLLGFIATAVIVIGFDLSTELGTVWARLVTVVVTLFAALVALSGVRSQIRNQNRISETNRLQDLAAHRATLPIALMELTEVSIKGMRLAMLQNVTTAEKLESEKSLRISDDVLGTLKGCIKASDETSQRWLAAIIANYQICFSRSTSFMNSLDADEVRNTSNYAPANLALDWVKLGAVINHTYDFSRGAVDSIPLSLDSQRFIDVSHSEYRLSNLNGFEAKLIDIVRKAGTVDVSDFEIKSVT